MIQRAKSIKIHASPEMIWTLMPADKISEWIPYMAKNKRHEYITEVINERDKYKPGTIMHFDGSCQWKVMESIENEMIKYHIYENTILGKMAGWVIFHIKSENGGCSFTYQTDFDFPNKLVERLVGNPITIWWFERQLKTNVEKLKEMLEDD